MSRQAAPIFTLSPSATALTLANRFVTGAGAYPAAGGRALGVARAAPSVLGEAVPVDVLGTAVVEVGAAIAADALVECDAAGRAVTKNTGVSLARLAPGEVATAIGDFVEVVLIPN